MSTVCPYCDVEVNEHQIEVEDGCCPECGGFIAMGNNDALFDDADQFVDDLDFDDNDSENDEDKENFEFDDEDDDLEVDNDNDDF